MSEQLVRMGSGECSECRQISGLYQEGTMPLRCLWCIEPEAEDRNIVCHEGCPCDWEKASHGKNQ